MHDLTREFTLEGVLPPISKWRCGLRLMHRSPSSLLHSHAAERYPWLAVIGPDLSLIRVSGGGVKLGGKQPKAD